MDLWERTIWLLIGGFIGFVLGYIVRSLHDIKEKVEHVEESVVDHSKWDQNDSGFMRHPVVADIAVILVLGLTIFAAFTTSRVNAELQRTVECITNQNVKQGEALKGRDSAVKAGTASEIKLWDKYQRLYKEARSDPKKIPALQDALNRAIGKHKNSLIELQETRDDEPYANPDVRANCEEGT